MEFLYEYGLFLLKAITLVIALAVVIGLVVNAGMRQKLSGSDDGHIAVTKMNDRFSDMHKVIKQALYDDDQLKKEEKAEQKAKKKAKKIEKQNKNKKADENGADELKTPPKRVFVVDFDGDIKASEVDKLREMVTAILMTATEQDEVVVRLESTGGMVHSYGLAASQLDRFRQSHIPLTVCVDKVAASGGYMMACVANTIYCAPFAIMGSIGVVAQLPNFHKLLKKHDVDYEMLTAGEYKRTLTVFGENTDKARKKFVEDLELTHQLFKEFVKQQRPVVDIDQVATGEIWFGIKAKELNLVDELQTSDDYITRLAKDHDVYAVDYVVKKRLPERLGLSVQAGLEQAINRVLSHFQLSRFYR